jgi:hypothetical protein
MVPVRPAAAGIASVSTIRKVMARFTVIHARLETVLEQLRDADVRRDAKRMRRHLEQRLMELLDQP